MIVSLLEDQTLEDSDHSGGGRGRRDPGWGAVGGLHRHRPSNGRPRPVRLRVGHIRFLMILFSFTERGQGEQVAPVLTVPTN